MVNALTYLEELEGGQRESLVGGRGRQKGGGQTPLLVRLTSARNTSTRQLTPELTDIPEVSKR